MSDNMDLNYDEVCMLADDQALNSKPKGLWLNDKKPIDKSQCLLLSELDRLQKVAEQALDGMGIVFHDKDGELIIRNAWRRSAATTPELAEALGLKQAQESYNANPGSLTKRDLIGADSKFLEEVKFNILQLLALVDEQRVLLKERERVIEQATRRLELFDHNGHEVVLFCQSFFCTAAEAPDLATCLKARTTESPLAEGEANA